MKHSKKASLILASGIIAVGLAASGAGLIYAQDLAPSNGPMANLVEAISQKFHLNKDEVQQVFDEQVSQLREQQKQKQQEFLSGLVKDGKLTQEKMDKIIAKTSELDAARESRKAEMQSKSPAERQAVMKAQVESLKTWAADNGIPLQYLRPFHGGIERAMHGFGSRRGMGMMN